MLSDTLYSPKQKYRVQSFKIFTKQLFVTLKNLIFLLLLLSNNDLATNAIIMFG